VEAAGIEPLFPINTNPMMANDFGFYRVKTLELPRRFDSPGVPYSLLESSPVLEIYWRRRYHAGYLTVSRFSTQQRLMYSMALSRITFFCQYRLCFS
jgi:hypothetical protein